VPKFESYWFKDVSELESYWFEDVSESTGTLAWFNGSGQSSATEAGDAWNGRDPNEGSALDAGCTEYAAVTGSPNAEDVWHGHGCCTIITIGCEDVAGAGKACSAASWTGGWYGLGTDVGLKCLGRNEEVLGMNRMADKGWSDSVESVGR